MKDLVHDVLSKDQEPDAKSLCPLPPPYGGQSSGVTAGRLLGSNPFTHFPCAPGRAL